jgi:hypothetical protein
MSEVRQHVAQYGTMGMSHLARDTMSPVQNVQKRWISSINPAINRAEDDFIIMSAILGNKWSKTESFLNNKPQTRVKDRYTKSLM